MKKIYDARGEEKKKNLIEENYLQAVDKNIFNKQSIGIKDMVMIGKTRDFPSDLQVDINWSINGLLSNEEGEYIIIEPLEEQINNEKLVKINEVHTKFDGEIKLSEKAIILIPMEKYNELIKDSDFKKNINKMIIRLYEGEENLALRMLLFDKYYTYLDITENGYVADREHSDLINYANTLSEKINKMNEQLRKEGKVKNVKKTKKIIRNYKKNSNSSNYIMISGLTEKTEGNINLGDNLYATTDIGKRRENQEDAILLIKDKENPKFKMIAVADGMGGIVNRRNSK